MPPSRSAACSTRKPPIPNAIVVSLPENAAQAMSFGTPRILSVLHFRHHQHTAPRARLHRVHRHDRKQHQLSRSNAPRQRKRFHYVANENCNCTANAPIMRLNTLEKLRDALLNLQPRKWNWPKTL